MKAKKKFGQNFLVDRYFISKIVNEINPKEENTILEIGPGKGAITEPVLKKINHISSQLEEILNNLKGGGGMSAANVAAAAAVAKVVVSRARSTR